MRTAITESQAWVEIRYQFEEDRFAQVISSVAAKSVLLLGIAASASGEGGELSSASLIDMIELPESIDPARTDTTLEGGELVLRLARVAN